MQITANQPIVFIKRHFIGLARQVADQSAPTAVVGEKDAQQKFFRKKNLSHATDAGV